MPHISEDVIGRYALDPKLVHDVGAVEAHLQICDVCRRSLDEIRRFDDGLADGDTWGITPDDLMSFATRKAEEDAEAHELLAEFDDAPSAAFVWADLPSNRDYYTGGVVRALSRRASEMADRDPRYALELADAAVSIAQKLSEDDYPAAVLHEWRGEAWKQKAAALFCLGRFAETLQAVDCAEAEYDELPHAGVGHVAVLYIRASVLYEQEDYENAARLLDRSAAAALHLGEIDRYMAALHMRASIYYDKREFNTAATFFATILRFGEEKNSVVWIARERLTLGNCFIELGELAEARRYLEAALRQFTALRFDTEVVRTQKAIGRLMFAETKHVQAIQMLRRSVADFTRLQMPNDAAIAAVQLAEMLHAIGRDRDIPQLLNGVVQAFTQAGKLTGALMALAYLKEAAVSGRLTNALTSHVGRYLSRVDRQPALLFAPPSPD
jgi:tetratricopeptide (TPR) repeat protein